MNRSVTQQAHRAGVRPLLLSANDLGGGAGIAAYRLFKGLLSQKVDARMEVQQRLSGDPLVRAPADKWGKVSSLLRPHLERLPGQWLYRPVDTFHMQWLPSSRRTHRDAADQPDVINLHWVCDGFLSVPAIGAMNRPVVWTLHDMWAFTGGCHYAGTCTGYEAQCGRCPTLSSHRPLDVSRWVHERKRKAWQSMDLTIVTPSQWLAEQARRSSLLRDRQIHVIPNGIDLNRFRPLDKGFCRQALGLPQDKKLVLFGAMSGSRRKGACHLLAALEQAQHKSDTFEVVVFGNASQQDTLRHLRPHYLGRIADELTLPLVYSAADIFVCPSEQDNLPNTMVEAMACGTPCVAFDIGGMKDIIDHEVNGFLATAFDTAELAHRIATSLSDETRLLAMSEAARRKAVDRFSIIDMASKYAALFMEVQRT